MRNSTMQRTVLAILVGVGLWACSGSAPIAQSQPREGRAVTAAQIFEQMVKSMQEQRAATPWDRRRFSENPYDMLDVKVEDWLATPEGKAAHAIKIPNPVPEDSGYRPGMTQQEYFEHLCKNEAGEFIFKTADDVEGIYQIRPRRVYTSGEWAHLYALEDPYGYWRGDWEGVGFSMVNPRLYSFFEMHPSGRRKYTNDFLYGSGAMDKSMFEEPSPNATIARYSGFNDVNPGSMNLEYGTTPRARYGITWRGVKRPMDREMGIAGGELIVLDLQTMAVMGVRRGYNVWNRGWTGRVCPRYGYLGGQDKASEFTAWFVAKVARPSKWKEYFELRERSRVVPKG